MMLNNDIELIEGQPIAYIKSLEAIVVSDLHLGYEAVAAKQGVLMPQVNLKKMLKSIDAAIKGKKVSRIIVDGDIKNEFSTVGQGEFNELYEFADHIKQQGIQLTLIKGNHDNFVERYKEALKFEVYRQEAKIKDYLFFHGEEMPNDTSAKTLIMGHEHPSIVVYSDSGRMEKLKCFLFGKYKGNDLLVLPAVNYFSGGTAINVQPKSTLLSPIFKHLNVDKMRAIALGYGNTLDFGTILGLRKAATQLR